MFKNGLFIISLGLLLFVYNANAVTGTYNLINIITAIILITIGSVVCKKASSKKKLIEKVVKDGN